MRHRFRFLEGLALAALAAFFLAGVAIIVLRFGFSAGFTWLQDVQFYAFAVLVPLAIAWASVARLHVKAEIGLFRLNGRIVTLLFCFLPALTVFGLSLPFVVLSWRSLEGSAEFDGLSGLFLVKTMLPIAFAIIAFVSLLRLRQGTSRDD